MIKTPDGLMFYLFSLKVGRWHDMRIYRESGFADVLDAVMVIKGKQYCIYVDAAYALHLWMRTAYLLVNVTLDKLLYKKAISTVCGAVEWTYKDFKQL